MNTIQFEWVLPEGESPGARKDLQEEGLDVEAPEDWEPDEEALDYLADAAFEPMVILAISLSATALIKVISDVVSKHRYPGGELFDLRGGALKQRPVPSMSTGTLILVTDDETQVFEPSKRDDGIGQLTQAIGAMASAGA